MANPFEDQLDGLVKEYESAREHSRHSDASDVIDEVEVRSLQTRCLAAVGRASGDNSVYAVKAKEILESKDHHWGHLAGLIGVTKALLSDIKNGYLKSLEELIHADVFGDFLEMSEFLNDSGYKDAAAVIAGSTLESHLRNLCAKYGIATAIGGKPKKADALNSELSKGGAYSKLDGKNVTAWLGLRNDAAHGNYAAYDKNQVGLLVSSIRDFIVRHPA